jgi:hypothetical protein
MGGQAGQKAGPAGGTGWRSGEGFAKKDSFFGQALHIGCGYGVAVWLNELAGIVRM